MINASGASAPTQTNSNKNTSPTTPGFPTHNPASQHQQFMNQTTPQIGATVTTATTMSPTPMGIRPVTQPVMPTNQTGATPPAAPKFPDPTKRLAIKAADGTDGGSDTTKPKKKLNLKLVVGVVILFLILLGSGAGFYLTQYTQQDIRQKAAYEQGCEGGVAHGGTKCQNTSSYLICNDGTWSGPNSCSSGQTCQGDSCKPSSTCVEACPNSSGILQSCTPPESDGSPAESICDAAGRTESCGSQQYCCPSAGGTWTTDMSACTTVTSKSVSGKVFCELEQPTSPLYLISKVPVNIFDSAGTKVGSAVTAAGNYSINFGLNVGSTFAVRVAGGTGNEMNPAFTATGATYCNPQHESCNYPSMPASQANIDFKTSVIPTQLQNTCDNSGYMTIKWTMAKNKDNTYVNEYILRLDYDESPDENETNTWNPGNISSGGNPNDYWRYVPRSVGACDTSTHICTVDTHVFDQETGESKKPWKAGKYVVNVNPVANSSSISNAASVIELCRASQTFTCNVGSTTLKCNDSCTVGTDGKDPCTTANAAWSCDTTSDKCRLTANPTSDKCEAAPLKCNDSCDPDATTDLCKKANDNWYCSSVSDKCRYKTNATSQTCEAPIGAVACNKACTLDAECKKTNENYKCDADSDTCRLASNVSSTTCEAPDDTEEETVGCNETCLTNADCSASNHICATTSDGSLKCRLESNPDSTSCTLPTGGGATTQPSLPTALPETGPEDWLNWLKAGLVTLGLGAALFFLL